MAGGGTGRPGRDPGQRRPAARRGTPPRSWRWSRPTATGTAWCRRPAPRWPAGATWLGVCTLDEALTLRAAGITAPVLAWLLAPGLPLHEAVAADVDLVRGQPRPAGRGGRRGRRRPAGRPGCTSRSTPGCAAAAPPRPTGRRCARPRPRPQADGVVEVVGVWSHLVYADAPGHPTIDRQLAAFQRGPGDRRAARLRPALPAPGQLGRHADPPRHPLRPGPPRHRRLRPVPGARASASACARR